MVKLIQNIFTANDGEQNKDNNIAKYLESNKDNILDLTEKHYENIVHALTNSAMTPSSSNPTLSSLQSPSIFASPLNQSDVYRIEELETYDDSKGDIAD